MPFIGHKKSVIVYAFFLFYRLAKQMAAINLKGSESLECTPMTSRLVQSEFKKMMEWTPGQGIKEDNEDSKEEEESKKEARSLIAT